MRSQVPIGAECGRPSVRKMTGTSRPCSCRNILSLCRIYIRPFARLAMRGNGCRASISSPGQSELAAHG